MWLTVSHYRFHDVLVLPLAGVCACMWEDECIDVQKEMQNIYYLKIIYNVVVSLFWK